MTQGAIRDQIANVLLRAPPARRHLLWAHGSIYEYSFGGEAAGVLWQAIQSPPRHRGHRHRGGPRRRYRKNRQVVLWRAALMRPSGSGPSQADDELSSAVAAHGYAV